MTSLLRRSGLNFLLVALLVTTGCTSWQRVGGPAAATPEGSLLQLFNPGGMYRSLGRLVATGGVPFIGTVAFVPGSGDSTRVLVGVSLANRALSFTREGDIYQAGYRVEYVLGRSGLAPITVRSEDVIRVGALEEALRTDESVLLQQEIQVPPGQYDLTVRVTDRGSTTSGVAIDSLEVPAFAGGSFTAPILAYEVRGRGNRSDSLDLVLNPRGSIAYGSDTLLVYLEGVGFDGPTTVPLQVRDELDQVVMMTQVAFTGEREIESQVVKLSPDSVPLGQLQVVVGSNQQAKTTSGIVSFSGTWVITNFDALLSLLRYFGEDARLSAMRDADASGKAELWTEFFRSTDPNRATPENERLDTYFARLAIANERFRDEGVSGWRTDRGEVWIVLGPPDQSFDNSPTQQGRFIRWNYNNHQIDLLFQDVTGFGRFRMTNDSRSDFERIRSRVQRVAPRM